MALKFFTMQTDNRGITVVTFNRPPVNAVSFEVYPEIRELSQTIEATDQTRVVEVWNKVDLIDAQNRDRLLAESADPEKGPPIAVSATTGEGMPALVELIETRLAGGLDRAVFDVPPQQLGMVDWLYRNGDVISREDNEDGSVSISIRATEAARKEIESRLGRKNSR